MIVLKVSETKPCLYLSSQGFCQCTFSPLQTGTQWDMHRSGMSVAGLELVSTVWIQDVFSIDRRTTHQWVTGLTQKHPSVLSSTNICFKKCVAESKCLHRFADFVAVFEGSLQMWELFKAAVHSALTGPKVDFPQTSIESNFSSDFMQLYWNGYPWIL